MAHFAFMLVSTLLLAGTFELVAAYSLPKASNGTDDDVNLKIVNGETSDYHTFPFISYIFTVTNKPKPGWGTECTASLLTENFILTAAHCVVDDKANMIQSASAITAYVGISNTNDQNKESRGYPVSRVLIHPDYRTGPAGSGHADVALLKLAKPVQYVDGIQNVCVDYSESIESYYIVAGYGTKSIQETDRSGNEKISPEDNSDLRYTFAKETRDAPYCQKEGINNLCLDSYNGGTGQSICYGDSGGPVLTSDLKVRGVACSLYADEDSQTGYYTYCNGREGYTRLSRYRDFIDSHVGSNNYCWSS